MNYSIFKNPASSQVDKSLTGQSIGVNSLNSALPNLEFHPLREELYNELHSRPFHVISTPSQITRIAVQHDGDHLERELLTALCTGHQLTAPITLRPCFHRDFGPFELRRERHMEFSGYTFIHHGISGEKPFERNAVDYAPREWVDSLPGKVVAAFHMQIEDDEQYRGISPAEEAEFFEKLRLVGSQPKAWRKSGRHSTCTATATAAFSSSTLA